MLFPSEIDKHRHTHIYTYICTYIHVFTHTHIYGCVDVCVCVFLQLSSSTFIGILWDIDYLVHNKHHISLSWLYFLFVYMYIDVTSIYIYTNKSKSWSSVSKTEAKVSRTKEWSGVARLDRKIPRGFQARPQGGWWSGWNLSSYFSDTNDNKINQWKRKREKNNFIHNLHCKSSLTLKSNKICNPATGR